MAKRNLHNVIKFSILSFFVIILFLSIFGIAQGVQPQGPDAITIAGSGRHTNETSSVLVQAQAGNVTALIISNTRSTQSWQGYYGNITGTITLDDAGNFTLYDLSLPNPSGEVYASNYTTVAWGNIYCMNVSPLRNVSGDGNNPADVNYKINGTQIELRYGINSTDLDGLNETFNDTYASSTGFRTGAITFDSTDGCSMAHPYTSELYTNAWEELLLSDNLSLVFTSLIRENANGFQPGTTDTYDFQMLVLENGHSGYDGNGQVSNYYFFVELN